MRGRETPQSTFAREGTTTMPTCKCAPRASLSPARMSPPRLRRRGSAQHKVAYSGSAIPPRRAGTSRRNTMNEVGNSCNSGGVDILGIFGSP